jgi:hypothetical protein
MRSKISRQAREELTEAVRLRYREANKQEKRRILDEFVAVTSCHRKHAIRLLSNRERLVSDPPHAVRRVYDEAVREALIVVWEASDRICSKRLKVALPSLIAALEKHDHLKLDQLVRERLLAVSAATMDRLLASIRGEAGSRKRKRRKTKPSKQIPIRTFSDWEEPTPGFLEIDFVLHCGASVAGSYLHSLVVTDVCSGWVEAVPLLAREQSLVVEGLELIRSRMPIAVLGIDSDNDSAFINDTLLTHCQQHQIEFTRCRAYQKNDQAWIEQKNGAVIRRFVGHDRLAGVVAGQTLAHLFQTMRLYVNYFQPSFKLKGKERIGAKTRKTYFQPATPCDRLLEHEAVDDRCKQVLKTQRADLDPLELLHGIRESQAALAALGSADALGGPGRATLDQFLAELPRLWESGEVRPTHRRGADKPHHWRTRKDPFEAVWSEVLMWLQDEPDASAKLLFDRVRGKYPEHDFQKGQLRTLQRRVREWRQVMAKQLVFGSQPDEGSPECLVVGAEGRAAAQVDEIDGDPPQKRNSRVDEARRAELRPQDRA